MDIFNTGFEPRNICTRPEQPDCLTCSRFADDCDGYESKEDRVYIRETKELKQKTMPELEQIGNAFDKFDKETRDMFDSVDCMGR